MSVSSSLAISHRRVDEITRLNHRRLELVNWRFGMFIHFSPTTYLDPAQHLHADHAPPKQGIDGILGTDDDLDPRLFHPTLLDCEQWALAAKSAGMAFGVFTTKHHDGFCNWPSSHSHYRVMEGYSEDVVGSYSKAFRKHGLKVGFYFSIRDRTDEIATHGDGHEVDDRGLSIIFQQLTELLTNYGEIDLIIFDGWGNDWHESPTFFEIPLHRVYEHVHHLQPDCLVLNHSRNRSLGDAIQIEQRAGMSLPSGSDWAAIAGDTIQDTWFWRQEYVHADLKSVDWIIDHNLRPLNQRNVTFLLNCAPNRHGLLDDRVMERLAEVGSRWVRPPDLVHIPESWMNWPIPSHEVLSLAPNESFSPYLCEHYRMGDQGLQRVALVTSVSFCIPESGGWTVFDLGDERLVHRVLIWNGRWLMNDILDAGEIQLLPPRIAFEDAHPGSWIHVGSIKEAPGYPSSYGVNAKTRYLAISHASSVSVEVGRVEIIVER